jgi:HK97 family phage major capsid protein
MAIEVNTKGVSHAKSLIKAGKVDKAGSWSFEASDGNKILGDDNWSEYEKWFLAIDTEASEETKDRYKFPFGKDGKVFRSGVIAAKQRAAQQSYDNIVKVADELLNLIDKNEKTLKLPMQARSFIIRQADIDQDQRTITFPFSSEEPVERWFGVETLDHSTNSVDLSRMDGAPLLLDHDPTKQIGVLEKTWIDGSVKRGYTTARFSKNPLAQEVLQDVIDGIRRNVSVGYRISEMVLEKQEQGQDFYRATSWQPLEVSIVSIPADPTVGIGRSEEMEARVINLIKKDKGVEMQEKDSVKVEVNENEIKKRAVEMEQKRVAEILAIGEEHNCLDLAKKSIRDGISVDEFKGLVLENIYKARKVEDINPNIGLTEKEARSFSIVRAIRASVDNNWSEAGFEKEVSDAVAKKLNKRAQGFYIPNDVMTTPLQRDLGKAVGTGSNLIATELLTSEFIELLRNRMMVQKMGARVLSGLVGDIAIPRQTGGAVAYWLAEESNVTESDQTFDQIAMTPKTVGAMTQITRKLLLQSSIDVEAFVRADLALIMALAVDNACINGTGTGQPKGILNYSGIGVVPIGANGGQIAYNNIIELWASVANANADLGALGWLTNSKVVANMKVTPKISGSNYPVFLLDNLPDKNGLTTLEGLTCGVSNQVPSNLTKGTGTNLSALIFGNWNDLIIGQWGAIDVLVDPYTAGASGSIKIRLLQDLDIQIRHPQSFAVINDIVA